MDLGLPDRVITVTGGSSGIGLAVVEALIAEGALVATCARDGRRLREATAHLDPDALLTMACDVTDRQATETFIANARARFGRLDGLVNNAGSGRHGRLDALTDQDWRDELDDKVFAVLNPTRAALPYLRGSDSARVVNISAVSAHEPDPEMIAIGTARSAVSNLSRALAAELAPDVNVNTVSLGVILTERTAERHRRTAPSQPLPEWVQHEALRRGIPLGRLGMPSEVASAVCWLVSPAAGYITGARLDVAGGLGHSW